MTISSLGASSMFDSSASNSGQPSASEIQSADSGFQQLLDKDDDAKNTLAEITQGGAAGYWAWQVKQMREDAAANAMAGLNLTPEKIAAMGTKERVATEEKIEQLVEQKIKQEIADDSKKKQQQILATSASLQSIITNTQSVDSKTTGTQPANPNDPLDMLFFGSS